MADYAISNVARRVVYTNTGVGPYAFTFEVLANTDIAVYRGSTLLTLTTDYSVTINANGTGSVTLVTAGTGNIAIVGARAIQRTSDYTTGGDLFASTLNTDLDSQTIYAQQVAETAERSIKAPAIDPTNINMTLPAKADRASKYLGFDANGNPVATPGTQESPNLGTMSTQNANAVAITGGSITNLSALTVTNGATIQGITAGVGANPAQTNNTVFGSFGLQSATTGQKNTCFGFTNLPSITSGAGNVAVGTDILRLSTNGNFNIGIGTSLFWSHTLGNYNIAIGYENMFDNQTGSDNIAIGRYTLSNSTTNGNTAIGSEALFELNTGANNTGIGRSAGYLTGSGSNITCIGYQSNPSTSTVSNEITLGNSSITSLRCQVTTITSLSDARDKKDIAPLSAGLNFVNQLKPVSFTWNMRDGGKVGALDSGFVAQDLQQAQTNTNIYIPNLVNDSNPDKLEAGYGTLIPVLTKAIQELSLELNLVKEELAKLKESK